MRCLSTASDAPGIVILNTDRYGSIHKTIIRRYIMWTKPEATEMRFGFEVTMYVCNR